MRDILFLLLVIFGIQACSQRGKSCHAHSTANVLNKDSVALEKVGLLPNQRGTFEDYAFVLNGKVIPQQVLVDYPETVLDKIIPASTTIKLEGREYKGAVYFHTSDHAAPPLFRMLMTRSGLSTVSKSVPLISVHRSRNFTPRSRNRHGIPLSMAHGTMAPYMWVPRRTSLLGVSPCHKSSAGMSICLRSRLSSTGIAQDLT